MLYKPSAPKKPTEPTPPERIILGKWPLDFINMTNKDGFTLAELELEIVSQLKDKKYHKISQPINLDEIRIHVKEHLYDSYHDCEYGYQINYSYPVENLQYDQQYKAYEKNLKKHQDKLPAYEKAFAAYEVKLAEYEAWKKSDNLEVAKKRHDQLLKELAKLDKLLK